MSQITSYRHVILLAAVLMAGCRTPAPQRSDVRALLLDDEELKKTLIPQLFESEIVVCLTGNATDERKREFETAALTWIAPLRSLTSQALVSRIVVKDPTDTTCAVTADRGVRIDPNYNFRAHYSPNERTIRISASDGYDVVLHEFGHAFGLDDTYSDDLRAACKEGQPRSVMCPKLNPWYFRNRALSVLLPDDVLGVRAAFCKLHAATVPDCAGVPKAGPRLNTDDSGLPKLQLDATFLANDPRCSTRGGVGIATVTAGTSTERSGLRAGACIQKINGRTVATKEDIASVLSQTFSSMLEIEAYASDGVSDAPHFVNARVAAGATVPKVDDIMLVYKGTVLRFDDGTTEKLPMTVPCQIRALGQTELRVACHRIPGWAPSRQMDLVVQFTE